MPKPLHGWREFLGEVGIIVIGVLIALGAEQVVETVHNRDEVAKARETLHQSILGSIANTNERAATAPCVDRRLDELADVLTTASRTHRLPPIGVIANPGRPLWDSSAWDTLVGGDTIGHFPENERNALGGVFGYLVSLRTDTEKDGDAWMTLAMMVGPGRPLDAATEGLLYQALSAARTSNHRLRSAGEFLRDTINTSGLPAFYTRPNPGTDNSVYPVRAICEPMGAVVPTRYGQDDYGATAYHFRIAPADVSANGAGHS